MMTCDQDIQIRRNDVLKKADSDAKASDVDSFSATLLGKTCQDDEEPKDS
jgi:hypothetical protein